MGTGELSHSETKSGSTVRIDRVKSANQVAVYFHCQTDLVENLPRALSGAELRRQSQHSSWMRRTRSPRPRCAIASRWR